MNDTRQQRQRKAKAAKRDEFYTQYSDIEDELKHHKSQLKGMVILCPCDDPDKSNFYKFLRDVKEEWEIKEIIATSYPLGKGAVIDQNGIEKRFTLQGGGSYQSDEVRALLERSDAIITNPPFSCFQDFVEWCINSKKKFLIIGNGATLLNKHLFQFFRDGSLRLGFNRNKAMWFEVGEGYDYQKEVDGKKFGKVSGVSWFCNLPVPPVDFNSGVLYQEGAYRKYDNFDALHIDKTNRIPMDYDGLMGVPITYLNKHSDAKFEIVGLFNGYSKTDEEKGLYCGKKVETFFQGKMTLFSGPVIDNQALYARLLIKKK